MITLQSINIPDLGRGITTITVEWVCQSCKTPRGKVTNSGPDAQSGWSNPCGHADYYDKVLKETRYETITIPEYVNSHHTGKTLTITVPWVCTICSGPRGKITLYTGQANWTSPCGHGEKFENVAKQAINQDDVQLQFVAIKTNTSSAVVNDHICVSCGNDRCSKNEKSCWRCGWKI